MTHFVLHLRRERHLALERRRTWDLLALGDRSHDLRVGMHLDELQDAVAVVVGHPILGFDLAAGFDVFLELRQLLLVGHAANPLIKRSANLSPISVGPSSPPGLNHAYVQLPALSTRRAANLTLASSRNSPAAMPSSMMLRTMLS